MHLSGAYRFALFCVQVGLDPRNTSIYVVENSTKPVDNWLKPADIPVENPLIHLSRAYSKPTASVCSTYPQRIQNLSGAYILPTGKVCMNLSGRSAVHIVSFIYPPDRSCRSSNLADSYEQEGYVERKRSSKRAYKYT